MFRPRLRLGLAVPLVLASCLAAWAPAAQPVPLDVSDTTVGAPMVALPLFGSTPGSCSLASTAEPFAMAPFAVDTDGAYTVAVVEPISTIPTTDDTVLLVYEGTFTPLSACGDFVGVGNEPAGSGLAMTLDAGTDYLLVVAGFLGTEDAFTVRITGPDGSTVSAIAFATTGPVDGSGNPLAEPVAVPAAGQTEVLYGGTFWNPGPGSLTIDGWPVITMPDNSTIVRRRPTVYTIPAGSSVDYSGGFSMLTSFAPGTYLFTYNFGDHDSVIEYSDTFQLVKSVPRLAHSEQDPRGRTLSIRPAGPSDAVRAQAALAAAGDGEWIAVAVGDGHEAGVARADAADAPAADEALPARTELRAGYPNPFNPVATVPFDVAEADAVRLAVYDVLGREVARLVDGRVEAGRHTAVFDANRLPSGTYFLRLTTANGFAATQRLTLMK